MRLSNILRAAICVFLLELAIPPAARPGEPPDYTQVRPEELGIRPTEAKEDPKTGFFLGGKNATTLVRKLTEINGHAIGQLEKDMRPDAESEVGSTAGFLGKDEALLDVLAEDNTLVLEELALTHQVIARHLHILAALGAREQHAGRPGAAFRYQGRRFEVKIAWSRGYQLSPFRDGTKSNADVTLVNLDNGKKLKYSLLVPFMIERYGFYEGKGTTYRVDPRQIVEVLDFLKKKEPGR